MKWLKCLISILWKWRRLIEENSCWESLCRNAISDCKTEKPNDWLILLYSTRNENILAYLCTCNQLCRPVQPLRVVISSIVFIVSVWWQLYGNVRQRPAKLLASAKAKSSQLCGALRESSAWQLLAGSSLKAPSEIWRSCRTIWLSSENVKIWRGVNRRKYNEI